MHDISAPQTTVPLWNPFYVYILRVCFVRARRDRTGKEVGNATSPSILASLVTILKEDGVSALFQVRSVVYLYVYVYSVGMLCWSLL